MKTLIKSPLKNAANNIVKIGSTPNARKIKSLDFDRLRENETFIKWIESSSKIFESVDLPNKRELKKLADFDVIGGGGGLAGLLAALGGLGLSLTGGSLVYQDCQDYHSVVDLIIEEINLIIGTNQEDLEEDWIWNCETTN